MATKTKTTKMAKAVTKKTTPRVVAAKATSRKAPVKAVKMVKAVATTVTVEAIPMSAAPMVAAKQALPPEKRYELVRQQAYFIAEKDGFRGDPNGYWQAAEKHVAELAG